MPSITQVNFALNLRWMKLIGLYPPEKQTLWHKFWSFVLYFIALVPFAVLGVFGFVLNVGMQIMDYNSFIIVGMVIYIPKFLPFVTNGNEIKLCIHYFDLEIFSLLEDADDVLVECTRVCRRNTKFFFSGAIFCWISLLIKPFIWGGSYRLPVEVWLPFSVENQPVLYVCVFAMLAVDKRFILIFFLVWKF